jgi:hypothetical protein
MLRVIYAECNLCLSFTCKPLILSVIMLNAVMMIVLVPSLHPFAKALSRVNAKSTFKSSLMLLQKIS